MRVFILALLAWISGGLMVAEAKAYVETPMLDSRVAKGVLPPVSERLPEQPFVVDLEALGRKPGKHGGKLRLLMGKQKDTRMMMVYGYARLIGFNEKLEFVPDILERFEVNEGREFIFHLRKGHKWSDGQPFTAEDFRYYWEDVLNDPKLTSRGLPKAMLVEKKPPEFEVIDETTVVYRWHRPNRDFLPSLAGSRPLQIFRPAHYLKKFHMKYGDANMIDAGVAEKRMRDWTELHGAKDHWYRMDNPDLPTLQAWANTTQPPSQRFVFERNPYFHRVDKNGRQLPYIDNVVLSMGETKLIPAKTGAGDSDLQGRYLRLDHYTFLKEGEKRNDYKVRLWKRAQGARMALFPNLNVKDDDWRKLNRDVRFRRALSLAINRREINQVVYYGLAKEGNNTLLPLSPLFKPRLQTQWAGFDLEKANKLLDEIGLTERNEDGIRLMKNGRPLIVTVDTAGESTEQVDVLELIHDSWLKAGIKLFTKPAQREVFRQRIVAGQSVVSVWSGISNGIATASMSPGELAPTSKYQLQWPQWGLWGQTSGKMGQPPELPEAKQLASLHGEWMLAPTEGRQEQIWNEMLDIHADNIFSIGIVNSALQPVVVNGKLRNVPDEGFYNWQPGAFFGIYKPDTFWFESN